MALQAENIADLVAITLKNFDRGKFEEIATDTQEYYALPQFMAKNRRQVSDGQQIQRQLMVGTSGAAQHVGLFATYSVNVGDVMQTISIPWRHTKTDWAIDEHEPDLNGGASKIVDITTVREADAMIDLASKMEETWWGVAVDDGLSPFSIQYWITYNATAGHNGGNNSAFSSGPGGLSAATYTRWKNYTANYSQVSGDDLIDKWRMAYKKVGFKSPTPIPSHSDQMPRYMNYMNAETLQAIENYARTQNDQLGFDVAAADGKTVFRGTPCEYVPYLDNYSTSDPLWMVNWSAFYPVTLKGWYLKHTTKTGDITQPHVVATFIDISWNTLCVNRRKQALLAKADPMNGV